MKLYAAALFAILVAKEKEMVRTRLLVFSMKFAAWVMLMPQLLYGDPRTFYHSLLSLMFIVFLCETARDFSGGSWIRRRQKK